MLDFYIDLEFVSFTLFLINPIEKISQVFCLFFFPHWVRMEQNLSLLHHRWCFHLFSSAD